MKPAPFDYAKPNSVEEVFDLLDRYGDDARLLAGGQSLLPSLNMRLSAPAILIDITGQDALRGIVTGDGVLRIGALTTYAEVKASAEVARAAPMLSQAIPWIAYPAIRNRGTVGGSLVHADPAAELPDIEIGHVATPTAESVLGAKGAGEAGTAGAPAAVANAINDAIGVLGAKVTAIPATPQRILEALGKIDKGQ